MDLIKELVDILNTTDLTEKLAYRRASKKSIERVIRCTAGKRKGKRVKKIADCFKRKNFKLMKAARRNNKKTRIQRLRTGRKTRKTILYKTVKKLNQRIKSN